MSKEKQNKKVSKERQEYLKLKPFADDLRKAESWCELDGVLNRYQTVKNLSKMGYRKQSENVIEPPCKIGDTVFVVSQGAGFSVAWSVYKSTVRAIHLDRYNKLFIHTETDKENIGGYVEVERVFNTKEEAERALEKIIEKMKGDAE